jgi:lambda family phage minor tail protein L
MAFTAWAASTAFAVGDIRRATTQQASGLVFKCTTAGTSDTTEPAWPTDIGSTIADNDVVWTAVSSVYEELSVLSPNAIIELFELELDLTLHGSNETFRWHNGVNADVSGNITWNGQVYGRFPVIAEGFEYTNTGSLPRPTLTVTNLNSAITALLIEVNLITAGNDLTGAKVKRIRTLKKFLDGEATADPYAGFPQEIWYVDRKSNENRDLVQFELASKFDLAGVKLPKRQIVANICQWQYRSSECGYTGSFYYDENDAPVTSLADDRCGKRLSSCSLRFGDNSSEGQATVGSNTLTIFTPELPIAVGETVVGFGIPSGTTVTSVTDGTIIGLSANATATTTTTINGTLQTNGNQIVLANVTGLAVGMGVSGTYIQSGTVISAISGTTITLSSSVDLDVVRTITGSFDAQFRNGNPCQLIGGSASVGSYILGPYLPTTVRVRIVKTETRVALTTTVVITDISPCASGPGTGTYTFNTYVINTQPLRTYTFTGSPNYTFIKSASGLPFGSFPSAGLLQ